MTWVIKAEHTGAFPGNPSFAWIKRKFYIFMHRHPAPSGLEGVVSYYYGSWKGGYLGDPSRAHRKLDFIFFLHQLPAPSELGTQLNRSILYFFAPTPGSWVVRSTTFILLGSMAKRVAIYSDVST